MQELVSPYNHQYIKILGSKSHKVCSVETNFSRAYYTSIGSELWGGGDKYRYCFPSEEIC